MGDSDKYFLGGCGWIRASGAEEEDLGENLIGEGVHGLRQHCRWDFGPRSEYKKQESLGGLPAKGN